MRLTKNILAIACITGTCLLYSGCTLKEKLNSTLTEEQAKKFANVSSLLSAAYLDLNTFEPQDQVFSLEENSSDECLVPTRGGDWDDNGVWRVIHSHTWNADHAQLLQTFNNLNKLNFDATNVLAFNPSASQAAQARFLRAFALYHLLDFFWAVSI